MSLGIVDVESKPYKFNFVANRPVKVGEYVIVNTQEGDALALVEDSTIESEAIKFASNYLSAVEASKVANENPRDKKFIASAKVLGLIEDLREGKVQIPSVPAIPGTEVREAEQSLLSSIFSRKRWIEIGTLLRNRQVKVSVDLNKIASRHLAILAATGSGKSNLLALIAKRVSEIWGTMLIFDYHAEYSELRVENVNHVKAKVNPKLLDAEELADMLDIMKSAGKQRSVLYSALTDEVKESGDFWGSLIQQLQNIANDTNTDPQNASVALRVKEIVERAKRRIGKIVDPLIGDPIYQISPNMINVLNLSELTEVQADLVISYYLDRVLEDRKTAVRKEKRNEEFRFSTPVIIAIEEAHTFIPADGNTRTKEVAAKIAREGRKFGVSLIVVSQRPSKLDQDVLSQMGSLAVSKITQPRDQNYITESTEYFSQELIKYLPSLNIGEVILLGQWVLIPSLIKVEKVEEKLIGADIDAISEWEQAKRIKEIARESTSGFIRET